MNEVEKKFNEASIYILTSVSLPPLLGVSEFLLSKLPSDVTNNEYVFNLHEESSKNTLSGFMLEGYTVKEFKKGQEAEALNAYTQVFSDYWNV